MRDIHKGGRPEKYDNEFYLRLLKDYEDNTYKMLSDKYHVSKQTIAIWLKKAREIANERKEEPV